MKVDIGRLSGMPKKHLEDAVGELERYIKKIREEISSRPAKETEGFGWYDVDGTRTRFATFGEAYDAARKEFPKVDSEYTLFCIAAMRKSHLWFPHFCVKVVA